MPKSRTLRYSFRGAALDEHQVRGLEVAVDDLVVVRLLEHVAELDQDAGRPVQRHRDARA